MISEKVTIGSLVSQREQEDNRKDCFVCYLASSGGCRFGTVHGFLRAGDAMFALIQRWVGVEADMQVHQLIYLRDNSGPLDLIKASAIRCLVGILVEKDHGHVGRQTNMIIGALEEITIAGIEQ
jgi:hypothetical protein